MNILIIRLSALGDVAMCIPAIYSAAKRYSQDNFYVLVTARFAQLFVDAPVNLHIVQFDRNQHRSLRGLLCLLRQLHSLHITHVADLHNVSRSWLIDLFFILSGAKVRMLNKRRSLRKAILKREAQMNIIEEQYAVFEGLGFPCTDTFEGFHFSPDTYPLPDFLPEKQAEEQWIGIAPFARYTSKIYPLELMQEVIQQAAALPNTRLFLFGGGKEEKEWCDTCATHSENIYSLPERMNLMQEMHLMQFLDVMVSMDSSNQHIASLMLTPVLTLWGGTTPSCGFQAWQQPQGQQCCAHLDCQPCSIAGTDTCPTRTNYICMRAYTPARIVQLLQQLLTH